MKRYYLRRNDSVERFISFQQQISLSRSLGSKNILEVGVGGGFYKDYLKRRGYKITTVDNDRELKPDLVANVVGLPLSYNSFEVVVCFEVLEHLPPQYLNFALGELQNVAEKAVIISVPIACKTFFGLRVGMPLFFYKKRYDGVHYWEIGYKGYTKRQFERRLKKYFTIVRKKRHPLCGQQFYVLKPGVREE